MALAAGRRATLARAGITPQRRGRAQSERSDDLGQGRPQRGLPLRLGQEVQALPRPVRVTADLRLHARTMQNAPAHGPGGFRLTIAIGRLAERSTSGCRSCRPAPPARRRSIAVLARLPALRAAAIAPGDAGACASAVLIGSASACLARIAPLDGAAGRLGRGASASARPARRRRLGVVARRRAGRPGAPCDRSGLRSSRRAWLPARLAVSRASTRTGCRTGCRCSARGRLAAGVAVVARWPSAGGDASPLGFGAGATPATTGRVGELAECAAAARVAGMVPGGVATTSERSCGATPIWLRLRSLATNTGCMPPSAPVLIGARRRAAASELGDLDFVLALLCRCTAAGDLLGHFDTPGTWRVGAERQRRRRSARRLRRRTRSASRRRRPSAPGASPRNGRCLP